MLRSFSLAGLLLIAGQPLLSAQTVTRGSYLQSMHHDSVVVRWRTSSATNSRVRYGDAPGNLTQSVVDTAVVSEHVVLLSGLQPGTLYYYDIGTTTQSLQGGDNRHRFRTAPLPGTVQSVRVWVIGDSGTADSNARRVRDGYQQFTGSRETDLWLMLGDNAYNSGTDVEYQNAVFNNMYERLLESSGLFSTFGNHDAISANSSNQSGPYYDIFTLPRNAELGGVASGTEAYYSFDHANIHFVCLDSSESSRAPGGAMLTWLAADLANVTQDWLIAFFHHPPYSKGSHNSDSETELIEMRQNALPLLEAAGVDLVLSGHSHSYERSLLVDGHYGASGSFGPAHVKDGGDGALDGTGSYRKDSPGLGAHEGAVYSVAGSSGKISGGALSHPVMITNLNELGSLVLDVHGLQLDVRFIDDVGEIRDGFSIAKGGVTAIDFTHDLVLPHATWRYHDQGVDLGTSWSDPAFDDSTWAQGAGVLGYGETFIDSTVSFGPNPNNKHPTTYFRLSFQLDVDPATIQHMRLNASFDDGFAAYVNGQQVIRKNLPTGVPINYTTLATSHEGGRYESINLSPDLPKFQQGSNVLAVEVHQTSLSSSDLVWDAYLSYECFEPALGDCAVGVDVLRVSGSNGSMARSVDVKAGQTFHLSVEQPATNPQPAHFALFGTNVIPAPGAGTLVPGIGTMCFPLHFFLTNNFGIGPTGFVPSAPGPWSIPLVAPAAGFEFALQGIVEESPGVLKPTNGVVLHSVP